MNVLTKTSPVSYTPLNPVLGEIHGTQVALHFNSESEENACKGILGVTDVSCFARFGIKGPQAADWLLAKGLLLPAATNTWIQAAPHSLLLRLGTSEYLLEDQSQGALYQALVGLGQATTAGVYYVQRGDAAFVLSGSKIQDLLAEMCMLDLRDAALPAHAVIMTQLAGISVTLLRQLLNGEPVFRLWCDGSYGTYLWQMLLTVAQELGGGAVGLASHYH